MIGCGNYSPILWGTEKFMVRILHTADVHLGLKFLRQTLSDDVQQDLVNARLDVLNRMVDLAMAEQCDLLVVAGDLFDSTRVPATLVRRAAEQLRRFSGTVIVLPGNHDYIESASENRLWPDFREALGDRHLVLSEPRKYSLTVLDTPVVLYAAPCRSRHSKTNGLGWMHEARQQDTEEHLRIAIAHGSLGGLSPDFNQEYFPMEREELERLGMDLWLLGHTHVRYPNVEAGEETRIFFPSVPEPDGFDCHHSGYAWVIDIAQGQMPRYRSVNTGAYRFHELEYLVESEHDLDQVASQLSKLRQGHDLVKLKLTGRLEQSLFDGLSDRLESFKQLVRHVEIDTSGVLQLIQQAQIDSEFTEGSCAHRLLSELAKKEEDRLALQLAYQLILESK